MVFLPVWYWSIPDGIDYGLFTVNTLPEAFAIVPVGLVLVAVAIAADARAAATAWARSPARCWRRASAAA